MKKKIKAWAVVSVNIKTENRPLISVLHGNYAVFSEKKLAKKEMEYYLESEMLVPCEITYSLPTKPKKKK